MATRLTSDTHEGLQRAAAVLAALGPSSLTELAPVLGAPERRALEAARQSPGRLSAQERRRLLASVARACRAARPTGQPPPAPAWRRGPGEDTDLLPCLAQSSPPFAVLDDTDPPQAADVLAGERPSVVALIVAHASDRAARAILPALPREVSSEVALLLPGLRRPAPGVLRRLDESLHEELDRRRREKRRRRRMASRLATALTAGNESLARRVLDRLAQDDPPLAEAVQREFAFADHIPAQAPEDDPSDSV